MNRGFRRRDRILNSAEFQRCQNDGKRYSGRTFVLLTLPNPAGLTRLGIVVTKKTGSAVVRNRWKRVIRDFFRLRRETLGMAGDHVVIVRGAVKGKPEPAFKDELEKLFGKARRT